LAAVLILTFDRTVRDASVILYTELAAVINREQQSLS
jgi:hypothetical protein